MGEKDLHKIKIRLTPNVAQAETQIYVSQLVQLFW